MKKFIFALVVWAFSGTTAFAQDKPTSSSTTAFAIMPDLQVGDRWVYQGVDLWKKEVVWTLEQVVESVDQSNAVLQYKYLSSSVPRIASGSTGKTAYVVSVQSDQRSDLLSGIFENVRFPLEERKSWTHSLKRRYQEGDVVEGEYTAKVIGWEEVTVPAGTFKAIKIEHRGTWRRPERGLSGGEEAIIWYSPDVKRNVKIRRIDYNSAGHLNNQFETQLAEYKLVSK